MIEICKWYNNADSPVLFMIDDLANVWVDTNGNGKPDFGEDWGFWKDSEYSSFRYLEERILKNFPEVKVTFFVPVGKRAPMVVDSKIRTYSQPINSDIESINFFKKIEESPKYELAYHGTTHGQPGETSADFIQEWDTYTNINEALETIKIGKEIFKEVVDKYPMGGKYCGYSSNSFSDHSIDLSGFKWWCRYWNRGMLETGDPKTSGVDSNNITNFDIKFFGENKIVDIPSTISGAMLNDLYNDHKLTIKGLIKKILKQIIIKKRLKEIDFLLENNLVISIQEHIAPSRNDGKIQGPNIFDDRQGLLEIFRYLKDKNAWFCTGSQLAEYVLLRESIEIEENTEGFIINNINKENTGKLLSVKKFNNVYFEIKTPSGLIIKPNNHIFNIPIEVGNYYFKMRVEQWMQ